MDFITLAVANWVLLASVAAVLYMFARRNRQLKGIHWFAHGLGMGALGIGAKLLHNLEPMWLAVLGSSALLLVGFMLLRRGLVQLTGRELRLLPWDVATLVVQTAGLAYFTYIRDDYSARFILMGLTLAVECGLAMAVLWAAPAETSVPRRPTLAAVGAYAVFNLLRSTVAVATLGKAGLELSVQTASAAVQLLFSTLFALGSVWLATSEQYEQLSGQMLLDTLTGLLNRQALRQALARAIERSRHGGEPLAVLAVDLDHFKHVNDTRGHSAGDAALCAVARTLSASVRANDLVTRPGGEEFVILQPGLADKAAFLSAERLRRAIAAMRFTFEGERVALTASFGIAVFDASRDPGEAAAERLLRQADLALYAAKRAGRNRTATSEQMTTITGEVMSGWRESSE